MYSKTFSTCELRQEAKCLKTLSPEKPSLIDSINFPMKVLLKTCIKQFTSWIIHFYSLLCTVCVFSLLSFLLFPQICFIHFYLLLYTVCVFSLPFCCYLFNSFIHFYLLVYTAYVVSLLFFFLSCYLLEFVLFAIPLELMVKENGEMDLGKILDVLLKRLKLM